MREGHGDLRASTSCSARRREIVDCIEFDRGLRELDVADDLAFLVMDLVASGGERFARALVRAYREAGGDPGEDRLIALLRLLPGVGAREGRAAARRSASRREQRARPRERRTPASCSRWPSGSPGSARLPLVIVICGVPAAGKSHLAEALAELSRLPHLSSDVTRKRLAGIRPRQRAADAVYSAEFNRLTYSELGRRARRRRPPAVA